MFIPKFGLVVYVYTLAAVRIERLKKREAERFGDRIREGGDIFEKHRDFFEWAAKYDDGDMEMRSRVMHEEWLKNCPCPIIRVDGTADCGRTASEIMERFYTKPGEPLRVYTALSVRWKNMLHRYFAPHNGK